MVIFIHHWSIKYIIIKLRQFKTKISIKKCCIKFKKKLSSLKYIIENINMNKINVKQYCLYIIFFIVHDFHVPESEFIFKNK